jgi:hypothetical protein
MPLGGTSRATTSMKFRCMLGDRFLDVQAESLEAAQEQAYAKLVRDLSPSDFVAWETGPTDEWRKEPTT